MSRQSYSRHTDWDPSCKIYIRGLRSDSNKEQLMEAFASYGKVLAVWIAQKPPGYAFLLMESSRDARDSCVGLNKTKIGGYRMQVEMATGSVRGKRTADSEERSSNGGKSRQGSKKKKKNRSRSPSRRSSHSRRGGEIENRSSARRPEITQRGCHGRKRRESSFKEGSPSRDGVGRMRNRSSSAGRRVVLVQQPMKVKGEVEKEGKQEEGLAVLIQNGLVDNVNSTSTVAELGDTELDYEASDDEIGDVVNENEKTSEPGIPRDETMKVLELENRVKDSVNEFTEIENRNLKVRNEELSRENNILAEEERYLRGERKSLERDNQELQHELEKVKWENDHLKQKNTQLMEGMLQLRTRLQGAVDVVDTMEVLQDEVLKSAPKRERGEGQ